MSNYHTERATVALRKLAEKDVAFAGLSLFCKHRDAAEDLCIHPGQTGKDGKPQTAPAWTDGKTISYGPSFSDFTLEEQMGVCAHEILHIALRHISRAKQLIKRFGGDYDNFIFNVATDAIINTTLHLSGRKLPTPHINLVDLFKKVFNETIDPEEAISNWDSERLYIRIVNKVAKMNGGSGAGKAGKGDDEAGKFEKTLRQYLEENGFEADFFPGNSDDPSQAQDDVEWQQRMAQALSQGKMAGSGFGKLGHKLADVPKSRTPWEAILRSVVSKAVTRTPRPSFERPTRRFLAMEADAMRSGTRRPVYEQGMIKNSNTPKVVVGVDVSGSISNQLLQQFAGEIAGIGRRTGAEIHVLVFDTKVISHTKMQGQSHEDEIMKIDFARGGGTCFADVVDKAAELDPSIIVILTDLCGPFGQVPGQIPVIWTIPDEKAPTEPPFGRVVSMAA